MLDRKNYAMKDTFQQQAYINLLLICDLCDNAVNSWLDTYRQIIEELTINWM